MKIAAVDDEAEWRAKICEELNHIDVEKEIISQYNSGEEFLKSNLQFDVVLMDIEMKEKDGFETIMEYKKDYPEIIPIILTTHTELSRKGYIIYRNIQEKCYCSYKER